MSQQQTTFPFPTFGVNALETNHDGTELAGCFRVEVSPAEVLVLFGGASPTRVTAFDKLLIPLESTVSEIEKSLTNLRGDSEVQLHPSFGIGMDRNQLRTFSEQHRMNEHIAAMLWLVYLHHVNPKRANLQDDFALLQTHTAGKTGKNALLAMGQLVRQGIEKRVAESLL